MNWSIKTTILLSLITSLFTACQQERSGVLKIAAAANTQFVLKEIAHDFRSETGIDYDLIFSSSGKITAQIQQGAPYDIFISADMKYPEQLYRNKIATANPAIYAYGKLVIWSMLDDIKLSIEYLEDPGINKIAIANPRTAPYGEAAVALFKNLGIYEDINEKLVFGESIAQANQFIVSRGVDFGVTAKSVVLSPRMSGQGTWIDVPENTYNPIAQGVVMIKRNENVHRHANAFYDFLLSENAKETFIKYGYRFEF